MRFKHCALWSFAFAAALFCTLPALAQSIRWHEPEVERPPGRGGGWVILPRGTSVLRDVDAAKALPDTTTHVAIVQPWRGDPGASILDAILHLKDLEFLHLLPAGSRPATDFAKLKNFSKLKTLSLQDLQNLDKYTDAHWEHLSALSSLTKLIIDTEG